MKFISIVRLWKTVNQRARSGTMGFDSGEEFTSKVIDAQTDVFNILVPQWESNENVKSVLSHLVKPVDVSLTAQGTYVLPDEFARFVRAVVGTVPTIPIGINEVDIIKSSPIRSPALGRTSYVYREGNELKFLPSVSAPATISYIRYPVDPKITLVPVSNEDDDFLEVSNAQGATVNLEWPDQLFNLFLYLVLEKLGIEMDDQLLVQYANLGISKETITNQR